MLTWTDTEPIYIKKDNQNIIIVSRYLDEGAFGGGTKPGDYQNVVKRQLTTFLKLETAIDTNSIDKNEWIKQPVK